MVQHALDRGYEVVGVCREQSVEKLDAFEGRITVVPGATDDREVIERAVAGCAGAAPAGGLERPRWRHRPEVFAELDRRQILEHEVPLPPLRRVGRLEPISDGNRPCEFHRRETRVRRIVAHGCRKLRPHILTL